MDNSGNVYIFKRFTEKSKYKYTLFSCDVATKTWKEDSLGLGENQIAEHSFMFNKNGNAILTGFYYPKNESDWKGMFYYRFNKTSLALDISKVEPFDAKFLQNFMSESASTKEGASLNNFKLRSVLPMTADGNILIIAEKEQKSQTMLPATTGQTKIKYEYSFTCGDIVVWCIKEDGSLSWSTIVPKSQTSKTMDLSERWDSFVYGLIKDKLYILWNNVDMTPVGVVVDPEKWTDPDGKTYTYKTAFDRAYWDKTGANVVRTTLHATFIYVVEPNGTLTYANYKYGLPLRNMHKDSPFTMSMNPHVFSTVDDGIILMGGMSSSSNKIKFGKIKL